MVEKLKGNRTLPEPINVREGGHTYGMFQGNSIKVRKMIKAMIRDRRCDKVVALFDADGKGAEKMEGQFREHQCPKTAGAKKIFVVAFETEVEEWITTSMGKREEKPSDYLRDHENYEKRQLPSQVERLDFEALKGLRSFNRFVEALKDP